MKDFITFLGIYIVWY